MHILVTGGCGFIGSHLVRHFVTAGHRVTVADRFSYAGKARRVEDLLPRVDLLVGDLAQGDLPYRCVEAQPDVVLHTAAETHVDRSILDPTTFLINNPLGTSRLLDAFAKHDGPLPRFVVYSTDEVYGPQQDWTPDSLRHELSPFNPSNAYSASKVAVEAVCNAFRVTHGLLIIIVRPCNVYGCGQHPEKAIPKWAGQLLRGESPTIYNDGQGFRDWMYDLDHCRAIQCVLDQWALAEEMRVINLARGDWRTDQQVFDALSQEIGGLQCVRKLVPGRPGHDKGYAMTGTRLSLLGFRPQVPFEEGLRRVVRWLLACPNFWDHDLAKVSRANR